MKKLILCVFAVITSINAYSKNDPEAVDIYLKGGKSVSGYIWVKEFPKPAFKISVSQKGEDMDLANVDSVVVKADTSVLIPMKWIEHSELPLNKEKEKTLLLRVYKGKNIDGYVSIAGNHTWTPTTMGTQHNYSNVGKFFYHVKGEDFAYAYYKMVPGDRDSNVRSIIRKFSKKSHPQLNAYMETDEFKNSTKGIYNNPIMVLPLFDEVLSR